MAAATQRAVVIGAGIGGLVSAALLAARGLSVTVIEAADQPGGKMRAVQAGGVAVDGGPTVFTLRGVLDDVFAACGDSLENHLRLSPSGILARHAWGADRLDLFADDARSADAIGHLAGAQEARGFLAFRAEARRIFDTLDASFMRASATNPLGLTWRIGRQGIGAMIGLMSIRPYESLWSALGDHFRDPRLRQLFGRYATYAGSSPFSAPGTLMLIADAEARGVWLVDGGMHALSRALAALAERQGALIRYDCAVKQISMAGGRAGGVTLASGEHLPADIIICNADPAALADGRFGPDTQRAVAPIPPKRRSLSALVWTAHAEASGFPMVRHNVFFSEDYAAEFASLAAGQRIARPSVYVCAQDRDDDGLAAGHMGARERVQIIVNAPAIATQRGDPEPRDTESLPEMEQCNRTMLDMLARAGLSLTLPPEATVLTTPAHFAAMFPSTGGALYGQASHGWAASFRRPGSRSRIPGLYCAGGATHPGAGVPMAALSGMLAADCALKDLASTSLSRPRAMPGGISTPAAKTAPMA